jgi:threonine dehydrogenase-like Zn-dependent dehydrogenase
VGLGLIGQIAARLFQLAGAYVIGWDTIARRLEIAREGGLGATAQPGAEDEVAATRAFAGGHGLDAAVLAFGGDANAAFRAIEKSMKVSPDGHPMGRLVVVGGAKFDYASSLTNMDIRRSSRTGPGYHDAAWEFGAPYPPVFMRWTTRTNLELCMRLISEGKLNVDLLTTHTVPLGAVEEAMPGILRDPDAVLGLAFVRG